MQLVGFVRNGAIELPPGLDLPDGTEVSVRVIVEVQKSLQELKPAENEQTFHEGLMKFAGVVKDAPPDYSIQHDHYLYGTPKSSP